MKRWRIHPPDEQRIGTPVLAGVLAGIGTPVLAGVLAGIGTPQLAASYLAAMHRVLPVTFCTVFAVDAAGRIETVSAASSYGSTAERTAERYVAERFDLLDPHMAWLAARPLAGARPRNCGWATTAATSWPTPPTAPPAMATSASASARRCWCCSPPASAPP